MHKVFVYSQQSAPLVATKFQEPFLWIEIRTLPPSTDNMFYNGGTMCKAKLDLSFRDCSDPRSPGALCVETAEQVWDFLREFHSGEEPILVNCEAGLSRSAGMGIAGDRPVIMTENDRVFDGGEKVTFKFKRWFRLVEIKIVTEDYGNISE